MDEQTPIQHDSQQKIRQWACNHDCDALQYRLAIERIFQILRCDRLFTLVQHLDVAAQRDRRDHPFGRAIGKAFTVNNFAESNGKTQYFYITAACHPIVSKLVEYYQQCDRADKCKQGDHI